jgi:hypothetical protein
MSPTNRGYSGITQSTIVTFLVGSYKLPLIIHGRTGESLPVGITAKILNLSLTDLTGKAVILEEVDTKAL